MAIESQSSSDVKFNGPERLTLAEKVVRLLHLPYVLGCIIWALVLFELPIVVVILEQKLQIRGHPLQIDSLEGILYLAGAFLIAIYFPLAVRFVRSRVLETEKKLIPLLPEGERDYHEIFSHSVGHRGQIIAVAVMVLASAYPVVVRLQSIYAPFINSAIALYVATMLGGLISLDVGCFIGLYRLGRSPLKFQTFRTDPKMGTKPIGSLSLSLAGAYFTGIVILIFFSAVANLLSDSFYIGVYALLIAVGISLFFLPILRVHRRMVEEKNKQDQLIQDHFDCISHELKQGEGINPLEKIQKLLSLEIADRKVQAISTWPFDTAIMGKLSVILLSVVATLFARYIWEILLRGPKPGS